MHPSQRAVLDDNPRGAERRRRVAWALIAGGLPLVAATYWTGTSMAMMVPVFIGVNLIIAGGRLLWLNLAMRETERDRQARLDRLER